MKRANVFASVLDKIFNSVFNGVLGLQISNNIPLVRVLFDQPYNTSRHIAGNPPMELLPQSVDDDQQVPEQVGHTTEKLCKIDHRDLAFSAQSNCSSPRLPPAS